MKISISCLGDLIVEEIFSGITIQTEEGNRFGICLRDNTVEMSVSGSNKYYRANMDTGDIEEM